MVKLENSGIYFDNKNGVYRPGEFLTGRVEIKFNSPKTVNGILMNIVGKSTVYWTESEMSTTNSDGSTSSSSTTYSNEEIYFKHKFYVVGGEKGKKVQLSAGQHVYPFRYLLPPNLPPSFQDHTKTGKIIYSVKTILYRPWRIDKNIEVPFVVETLSNFHDSPLAKEPGMLVMEKQFGLIFKSNPLKTVVKTKDSSLVAGQTIPLTIEVDNGSDTAICSISVKLRQVTTCHATSKDDIVEKTLSKNHITSGVGPNTSASFRHTVEVPSDIVLYDLSNCKIIDVGYVIKVELHSAGVTQNLVGSMPLYPVINLNLSNNNIKYWFDKKLSKKNATVSSEKHLKVPLNC